jgi:hypothetical protein
MHTSSAQRCLLAFVLLLPTFAAGVVGLVSAQTGAKTASEKDVPTDNAGSAVQLEATACASDAPDNEHAYSGWQNCDFCHGRTDARTSEDDVRQDVLVTTLTESTIWRHKDKHELAARVLIPDKAEQNLAYRMQQMLGDVRYEALVESQCQTCHVAGQPIAADYAPKPNNQIELRHNFGVTCEACHGPAKDWIHPHWEERSQWRYQSPAEKQDTGFVNLRDPATKARKCLSCHLGDAREGKIVTHEMYAAGHPPLAGFDAATYSLAMPRHWVPLSERSEERFAKYRKIHGAANAYAANTREVLLGGLAALESNLKLLSDYAAAPSDHSAWPEFALYDCFACHHELQPQSLLLRSRGGRQAGRPPLRMWPNTIAGLALGQTEGATELARLLSDVSTALTEQPFAERTRLASATTEAVAIVCQEIKRLDGQLDRSSLTDQEARNRERQLAVEVLNRICDLAVTEPHDYDSARQLVWAFERVFEDYKKLIPAATNHAAIDHELRELKALNLMVDLPVGKKPIGEPTTLYSFLEARGNYKPQALQAQFARLRDAVREATQPRGRL